ncbi:MAG: hypothetical protein DYH02_02860 [Candidatus Omnitrophica bacterium COP1]|nr:hypothetical protein [Candidatus Omnitrophica bacterium COP1]
MNFKTYIKKNYIIPAQANNRDSATFIPEGFHLDFNPERTGFSLRNFPGGAGSQIGKVFQRRKGGGWLATPQMI